MPSGCPIWTGGPIAGFQPPVYPPVDELSMLTNQAQALASQLEAITSRLEELEKES
jgi:hypothetical protein